jgi:hypothetical protein
MSHENYELLEALLIKARQPAERIFVSGSNGMGIRLAHC